MIELYKTEADCCGCSACEAICPKGNIVMKPNNDGGFMYPVYLGEDNCINCNLCLKVCPLKSYNDNPQRKPTFYAGISKDIDIWKTSTSGGVFTEICKLYKDYNPIIFGARWADDFEIIMDYANGLEEASVFRKSKYIAANVNKTFPLVQKFLREGRFVIWGGTPCQINGLKNFLKKDYSNLITVDFACHGQGSPDVFKKWISYLGKKYGSPVKKFKFRERKYIVDHLNSNCTGYELENGKNILVTRDYYHHAFVYGWHLRKSCLNCTFAEHRMSDITLADFKSIERGVYINKSENASDILANTDKGEEICQKLKSTIRLYTPSYEMEIDANPKISKSLQGNQKRDLFMRDFYDGMPIEKLIKKYARILPTQWMDYNMSVRCNRILGKFMSYIDEIYKIIFRCK